MDMKVGRRSVIGATVLSGLLLAGCTTGPAEVAPRERDAGSSAPASPPAPVGPSETADAAPADIDAQLAYLIEEEKLAHDVYVALGELWGSQIFARISSSESTHEEAVANLLPTYGVDDPRSADPGVFTDTALQALYDDLIAQGSQSLADAVQVGITIEKTDIADLSAAIPNAPEDVASVLERLLTASQNHLAAFERQA
jgi:hypothetical protein